jgi:hypothetical protein
MAPFPASEQSPSLVHSAGGGAAPPQRLWPGATHCSPGQSLAEWHPPGVPLVPDVLPDVPDVPLVPVVPDVLVVPLVPPEVTLPLVAPTVPDEPTTTEPLPLVPPAEPLKEPKGLLGSPGPPVQWMAARRRNARVASFFVMTLSRAYFFGSIT